MQSGCDVVEYNEGMGGLSCVVIHQFRWFALPEVTPSLICRECETAALLRSVAPIYVVSLTLQTNCQL